MNQIFNVPEGEYEYEFMVILPDGIGNFYWHSNHEDGNRAAEVANAVGGVVSHNLRVHHKRKRDYNG